MKFIIDGIPRTKKNSMRPWKRGNRTFLIPSAAATSWTASAVRQLQAQLCANPIDYPVSLNAQIYRARRTGDLGNYLAAICDALESAEIVTNDKFILSFDGSRLKHDACNPRVEIELTEMASESLDPPA